MQEINMIGAKLKNKNFWLYFLIILIGFLIYLPTLSFDFTYLDDNAFILENHFFLKNISNIFKAFKHQVFYFQSNPAFYYRPLLIISYIIDTQLGAPSSFNYHFTSIIIHLLNSCLIFYLLKKIKIKDNLSFFSSLIFTVHPALTQTTAWLPARNDSLLALFIIISFIFFIKFLETEKTINIIFHLLSFLLALFSKENAIFLPAIIIFYFYLIHKQKISRKNKIKFIVGWIAIILIWFVLRNRALSNSQIPKNMDLETIVKSLILSFPALIQYIGKLLFPFNLSVLPIIKDTTFIYGILSLIILIFSLFFSKNKKNNYVLFGCFWFLIFLLPSFIQPQITPFTFFIENRLYLPFFGFLLVILEIDWIKKLANNNKILLIISVPVIILFSVITLIYSQNFKNRMSFWKKAVNDSPHLPMAHKNLGAMYHLDGYLNEAEIEYKKALELNPLEPIVHNNLGLIYTNKGEFEKAEKEFIKELEINPFYDNAYYNFGILYYKQKKYEEAENLWKKALELNPNFISVHHILLYFYLEKKDLEKAKFHINYLSQNGVSLPLEILNMAKENKKN